LPGQFVRRQFLERRKVEFIDDQRMQLQPFVQQAGAARDQV
jgi:hypothetical protein